MHDVIFTDAQSRLIRAETGTYVEACPGAGKTQAIVQRFIDRPLAHPRRGIALISFTNAAIDEARERCATEPALKKAPNFVGTIDSFINRFLVGPTFLARRSIAPRFYESWSTVPHSQVRVNGVQSSLSLDWFAIRDGAAHLIPQRVPIERRRATDRLSPADQARLGVEAMRVWNRFVDRGTLSASAARVAMRSYLGDPERREQLGTLLADRFVEVIIDEVQDCSADDILVLDLLHEFGVTIVAVGDPDQSIYGFRSDAPADIGAFLVKLAEGERLNGNFRSSPAICAAIDSLRTGSERDDPVGRYVEVESPVVLLSYKRRQSLPEVFASVINTHGISRNEIVVLAHSAEHARVAAGAPGSGADSTSKLVVLAQAHHLIGDPQRPPAERVAAMRSVERTVRELGVSEVVALDHPDYLDACGLSERTFREGCLRLAAALPRPFDMKPSEFRTALAARTDSQAQLRWTSQPLRSPPGDTRPTTPETKTDGAAPFRHSTIHGLKGRQSPAVGLVIPESRTENDGVRQWCGGLSGEERRVLYVGASRAERLLIIAAHESVLDAVKARLENDGVPTEVP